MVEGIGTYDGVFGIEETVALTLCRRHADALRDELVILEPSADPAATVA
jgi:hypothetical protein